MDQQTTRVSQLYLSPAFAVYNLRSLSLICFQQLQCHQVQIVIRGQEYTVEVAAGKKEIVIEAESSLDGVLWKGAFNAKSTDLRPQCFPEHEDLRIKHCGRRVAHD